MKIMPYARVLHVLLALSLILGVAACGGSTQGAAPAPAATSAPAAEAGATEAPATGVAATEAPTTKALTTAPATDATATAAPATEATTAAAEAAAPSVAPIVTGEPLTISFLNVAWGTPPPEGTEVQKLIEQRLNVKLNPTWVPFNELENRVNVAMASGDMADITHVLPPTTSGLYTSQQVKAIEEGLFHDLTPYLTGPDFAQNYPNLAKIPQNVWKNMTFRGKIYGVPRHLAPVSFDAIKFREDLFTKAGMQRPDDVPKTVDELTETILKLNNPPAVYGFNLHSKNLDGTGTKIIANAFTGVHDWGVTDDGDFFYQTFMPEYKDFLTWVKNLYDAGAINPEFPLEQNNQDFLNGKAATIIFRWHAYVQCENTPGGNFSEEAPEEADVFQIPPIMGPKGWAVEANTGFWTQSMISSKVPEENVPHLLQFIDYVASSEHKELYDHGIQGMHYEEQDGKKVNTPKYEEDVVGAWGWFGHIYRGNDPDYWVEQAKACGTSEEDLQMLQEVADQTLARYEESKNIRLPAFNLYSPTFATGWSELTKDLNDNRVKFVTGDMSAEEWDQYVQGITSSETYQKILEEFKKEYEANQ